MYAIFALMGMALAAMLVPDPVFSDEDDQDSGQRPENGPRDLDILIGADGEFTPPDDAVTPFQQIGSDGPDFLRGSDLGDLISGGGGDDRIDGLGGDDMLFGGDGDDMLFGHEGDDTLYGEAGDDRLVGGNGSDTLFGGAGDDTLEGLDGDDVLFGGDGADTLQGGRGDDTLDGRGDGVSDYLNGEDGDDRLIGGGGDVLTGGAGADSFNLRADTDGVITDFDASEDRLEVEYEGDRPPVLSTVRAPEGLTLMADETVVAVLQNVTELDLAQVALIPVNA